MCISFDGFPVEIWGTVSDWIMILVTAITGFFIILTFRKQKAVTYLQQLKFIFDIQPVFKFYYDLETITYNIELTNNFAYDLNIKNNITGYEEIFVPRDPIVSVPMKRKYDILKGDPKYSTLKIQVNIDVFFRDALNNRYCQNVHGQYNDMIIDPPLMIDETGKQIKFLPPKFKQFN